MDGAGVFSFAGAPTDPIESRPVARDALPEGSADSGSDDTGPKARREHLKARRSARTRRARAVRKTMEIVAANLDTNLKIDVIARQVGCSPYHLMRLFRNETGRSVRRYRNELRLKIALKRLEAGERCLTGLAMDLGFSSHSHMTGIFRRLTGAPPSAFRRQ